MTEIKDPHCVTIMGEKWTIIQHDMRKPVLVERYGLIVGYIWAFQ